MESLQKTWMSDSAFLSSTFLSLCQQVDASIKDGLFKKPAFTVILACSGGPDSVFAAYYLYYKIRFTPMNVILCYFDHEWRMQAKDEVIFCRSMAEQLGFIFETRTASAQKEKTGQTKRYGSKEAEARELRYAFLREMKEKYGADYIVLGHHKDDQIETFFIRMIRGTSISGLCGMKIIEKDLWRPLLVLSKKDIVSCLDVLQIPYCVDTSNLDCSLLRNRVRHMLIPILLEVDARSIKNIEQVMYRIANAEKCLEDSAQHVFNSITTKDNERYSLSISKLQMLHKELQYRVLLLFFTKNKIKVPFSERFFKEVLRFLRNTKSKSHHITKKTILTKENDNLWVS